MIKRYTFLATLGLALTLAAPALADPAPKITICHATSSETNPYVTIVVSENAYGGHFENPGTTKAGHEDDLLFQGEVACPTPTTPDTTATTTSTTSPPPAHPGVSEPTPPSTSVQPEPGTGSVPPSEPQVSERIVDRPPTLPELPRTGGGLGLLWYGLASLSGGLLMYLVARQL